MIKINSLTKIFENNIAVNNLNLEIKDGEVFWLLGRNWAWKTTTIKMIVGLLQPTKGEILFDWKSINKDPIYIKKQIAYIPDTPYVYEKLTGEEFLIFIWSLRNIPKKETIKRAEPLIKLFNIEHVLNKKTEEYSHWMRQKLIFTASLIHKPKYLIVDEPMVWLDPQSAKAVKEIFKLLARKWNTVILTTHQLWVAQQVCDRIWIIHQWKLKALFEDKSQFENQLEEKFIQATWGYKSDILEKII